MAVHRNDAVAGLEPCGGGRSSARDRGDVGAGPVRRAAADGEEEEEDQERDDDVRERPGGDDGDPLPCRTAPVGLRRGAFLHLPDRPLRRASCGRRQRVRHPPRARARRRRVLPRRSPPLRERDGPRRRPARGSALRAAPARETPQVTRGRPVHAGKLNHSAERDHPDPVLDALAPDLEERRRESDVEAPRAHPDRARDDEMPELVKEDEQYQAGDDHEVRHAAASAPSAISRAARSASTRSSTSLTASVPAAASVSPTTSGIPRNGSCPARNAATATSFAAL